MMNFNGYDIEKYKNCDVFHNVCELQPKGFSKEISRDDILNIATSNRCPIVVKDETGKWYLKGTDRTEDFLRDKILKSNPEKKKRYVLYFIPELCEQQLQLHSSSKEELNSQMETPRTTLVERRQEHWDVKITKKKNEAARKRLFEALIYGRKNQY